MHSFVCAQRKYWGTNAVILAEGFTWTSFGKAQNKSHLKATSVKIHRPFKHAKCYMIKTTPNSKIYYFPLSGFFLVIFAMIVEYNKSFRSGYHVSNDKRHTMQIPFKNTKKQKTKDINTSDFFSFRIKQIDNIVRYYADKNHASVSYTMRTKRHTPGRKVQQINQKQYYDTTSPTVSNLTRCCLE